MPAPGMPKPLRERCGVQLTVKTDTSTPLTNLHELITSLNIAFCDIDASTSFFRASTGKKFTHIVQVVHSESKSGYVHPIYDDNGVGLAVLYLGIPLTPQGMTRDFTLLTLDQLRVARDFLSLALPYNDDVYPDRSALLASNVLITGCRGTNVAADIMSIVLCYLVFVLPEDVEAILSRINEEADDVPPVWKHVLGHGDSWARIERAAMAGL